MRKLIILKYGELNTKKANIGLFLKTLKTNLQNTLQKIPTEISFDKGRMYILCEEPNYKTVLEKIQKTFGLHEIALGYELETNDWDAIRENVLFLVQEKNFQTFKVETKRSNKEYFLTSPVISKKLGGIILEQYPDKKVEIRNPEVTIHIEIRKTNAYIYFETIKGLGGYPVGTLGKGLLMISGGIDSPVAGFLSMKRGVKIEGIYFDSPPHTSVEAKNKVLELTRIIGEYQNGMKVHIIPFTNIQETIYKEVPKEYIITIMRRMMYRISEKIARKNNCKIIVNGESIGQVASQTLDSMNVINEVVKIPVIRPVACFDKLEIIELAKKIKTYETSILPYEDCCTIFVPEHPVIYPKKELCVEYETYFDYETLINEAIKNETIIKKDQQKNEFEEYL